MTETARARYVVWARLFCREVMLRAAQKCYNKSSSNAREREDQWENVTEKAETMTFILSLVAATKTRQTGEALMPSFYDHPQFDEFFERLHCEMVSAKQEAR